MGLFNKVSKKELPDIRNDIFVKNGIPALGKKGFIRSPFKTANYGRNNLKDFTYDLCRLNDHSQLEMLTTHISRGDRWIKIFLNIFDLQPTITKLDKLKNCESMQFHLPPNSITEMRLSIDEYNRIPLLNTHFFDHKLSRNLTKWGHRRSINKLRKQIEKDLLNIDKSVARWYKIYQPLVTGCEGFPIININDPHVEVRNFDIDREIYYYRNFPLTGIVYENFQDGGLKTETQCVGGVAKGLNREYYRNGQLMEEYFEKDYQIYGIMREWDESGNIIYQHDNGPEPTP